MGVVINSNTTALFSSTYLNRADHDLKKSIEHISSGQRINSSDDDAAGMQISAQLESQIRGIGMALRNGEDALSVAQVAGALQEEVELLLRMYDLALQAANGSNGRPEREALNAEVEQIKLEITRIADTTTFGTQKILNGYFGEQNFQVGANGYETISLEIGDATASGMGLNYHEVNQKEMKVIGSTQVVELDEQSKVNVLTVTVDDRDYQIDLHYAMTSAELETKLNNIEGLSYIDVDMMKGTGTQHAQEAIGLDDVDEFAPIHLRIEKFVPPRAVVSEDEKGLLMMYFLHDDGTEHELSFDIDPLVADRQTFQTMVVDAINAAQFRGIEAVMNETDWNMTIQYTGSQQFPKPPRIDFEYFSIQKPGFSQAVQPPPTFELEIEQPGVLLSDYAVVNHDTTPRGGNFTIEKGEPVGFSTRSSRRAEAQIELTARHSAASANAQNQMKAVFSIVNQKGEQADFPPVEVNLNAGTSGGLQTFTGFANQFEAQAPREAFKQWMLDERIDEVFPTFTSVANTSAQVNYAIYFNDDVQTAEYLDQGYQLQVDFITVNDDAASTAQLSASTLNAGNTSQTVPITMSPFKKVAGTPGFMPNTNIGMVQAKADANFGEDYARLTPTIDQVGLAGETGRYHMMIYDETGTLLHRGSTQVHTTNGAVTDFSSVDFIVDTLYQDIVSSQDFVQLERRTGLKVNRPATGGYLEWTYNAIDEKAPTQIQIKLQYEVMQTPPRPTPPIAPAPAPEYAVTFSTLDVFDRTSDQFQFDTSLRPEGQVGDVQIGDLYGGKEGAFVLQVDDASQRPPQFKPPEFILVFDEAKLLDGFEKVTWKQPESALNIDMNYADDVKLLSVADVNVLTFEATQTALEVILEALSFIASMRSDLGAKQNRMLSTSLNNENIRVSVSESRSRIIDLDFAEESTRMAQMQVLQQSSAAMLTQANQVMQVALTLIQS